MTPLQNAIEKATGQAKLAADLGVSAQAITNWKRDGVPEERCPAIERLTGVRCEELRPDIAWTRNADGEVTGYHVPLKAAA